MSSYPSFVARLQTEAVRCGGQQPGDCALLLGTLVNLPVRPVVRASHFQGITGHGAAPVFKRRAWEI